jgi:hypothetical protein
MVVMAKHEKFLSPQGSRRNAADGLPTERFANGRDQHVSIDDQIRMRAYELYLERGGEPNHDLGDWLQAERECRGQSAETTRR